MLHGALWWAWAAYAWLTNTLDPEEGVVRLAVFGSIGAMLIIALVESIVAIGIGAAEQPLGAGVIAAALLGITIAAAPW